MSVSFFVSGGNLENTNAPTYAVDPTLYKVYVLDAGQAPTNGLVVGGTSATLNFGDTGTITFSWSGGVYEGWTPNSWAPEATSNGNYGVQTDYYAATAGNSVTFNFGSSNPQTFFGLTWGSINSDNVISFYKAGVLVGTLYGSQVESAINPASPSSVEQGTYYVGANISGGFDSVTCSNYNQGFEFGNVSYYPTAVTNISSGTPAIPVIILNDGAPICFLGGSMIATPRGEVAVERLKAGDLVTLADGRTAPVSWLGRQTIATAFADALRVAPIRIKAGALADSVPSRDLLLSPGHAVLVNGILAQAGALVNGVSIVRETDIPARFTYYHVEVADHSLILAENTPAETFIDNVERMGFDNWEEHPGGAEIIELDLPRATSHRQVPRSIRAHLAARAAALYGDLAIAA